MNSNGIMTDALNSVLAKADEPYVTTDYIKKEIAAILSSFDLQKIRRYYGQVYWWDETDAATRAGLMEPGLALENVAAHSWHVADTVLLLAENFDVDVDKAIRLALIHDKLEMLTGDFDPVGQSGTGSDTHAFNTQAKLDKLASEKKALDSYLGHLSSSMASRQRVLFDEVLQGLTKEAKFIKSIDKLQALAFVHKKKSGEISDDHLGFSLRYSARCIEFFPSIEFHYTELLNIFLRQVAERRGISLADLVEIAKAKLMSAEVAHSSKPLRIALMGKSGAGKSEVSKYLARTHGVHVLKTGALCRSLSRLLFGNEEKSSTQSIDDVLTRLDPSIFLRAVLRPLDQSREIAIDALRFSSDLELAVAAGFKTVRIVAGPELRLTRLTHRGQSFNLNQEGQHRSETELDAARTDYEIENTGSFSKLFGEVDSIIRDMR